MPPRTYEVKSDAWRQASGPPARVWRVRVQAGGSGVLEMHFQPLYELRPVVECAERRGIDRRPADGEVCRKLRVCDTLGTAAQPVEREPPPL